jgi:paraquat-inducible protein B
MTEPATAPPATPASSVDATVSPAPLPPPGDLAGLPSANLAPRRWRLGWYWLFPALTVIIVAVVLGTAWARSGVPITLHFREGHGLKPGDAVRCRGIIIGEVRSVQLASDTGGVVVQAELRLDAREVAQSGSRF